MAQCDINLNKDYSTNLQTSEHMVVDQTSFSRNAGNGHSSRINNSLSRTPCLSFAEPMLSNNSPYKDSFTTLQTCSYSIIESPSQDRLSLIRRFCKACWATPWKMHFDFCPVLCGIFAKIFLAPSCRPQTQPSAEGASKEQQTPGALVFGSCKASLLGPWLLLLELV